MTKVNKINKSLLKIDNIVFKKCKVLIWERILGNFFKTLTRRHRYLLVNYKLTELSNDFNKSTSKVLLRSLAKRIIDADRGD